MYIYYATNFELRGAAATEKKIGDNEKWEERFMMIALVD